MKINSNYLLGSGASVCAHDGRGETDDVRSCVFVCLLMSVPFCRFGSFSTSQL